MKEKNKFGKHNETNEQRKKKLNENRKNERKK